jgi:uracil-DNA glycosylase
MLAGDGCVDFPCVDVRHAGHIRPELPARLDHIRVMMVAAAPPADRTESVDPSADPLIRQETLDAFRAAGYDVANVDDIRKLGVYVTTAVKCPKLGFGLKPETVAACSHMLETEIGIFPNLRSILLMGNTAIKAINEIAERQYGAAAIPTGSAYKVKAHEYHLGEISLFPSYPESGRNLSVEGDRNEVIAVDIRNAIEVAGGPVTRSHQTRPKREPHRLPEPRPREVLGQSVESSSAGD